MNTRFNLKPSEGLSLMLVLLGMSFQNMFAEDAIFSGPQPGEPTTPFNSIEIIGPNAGKEINVITENDGRPTVMLFVHGLERSILPLMRAVDQYGSQHADKLKTEFVFLAQERVEGMQRFARSLSSVKFKGRSTLSVDGIEGPGNYGLNKECLLTIIVADDNQVHGNFALVQPGIADAEKVIAAIAKIIGDPNPPTAAALASRDKAPGRMRPDAAQGRRPMVESKDPFPGAVPEDARLQGLLRQYIKKSNTDGDVDRILDQVRAYIKGKPALHKQAVDGWTRVLHFKDRYGTAYAVEQGQAFLIELTKPE